MGNAKKIVILIIILVLVGVIGITISIGGFFFTTKYYDSPMEAFCADYVPDAVTGPVEVRAELGTVEFDKTTGLFLGKLDDDCFVAAVLKIKDGKYAFEGTSYIYDLSAPSDGSSRTSTKTENGVAEWAILYSEEEVAALSGISEVHPYQYDHSRQIYLVVFL